ncbi:MAG TPA: FAD-dependent oxidoreductase [Pseudolabrys sp.]|jgi:fumarate reductase flavoprotein subunit|nr:FAD-dependent oxidoreductase [Pseudolabrys sp.]
MSTVVTGPSETFGTHVPILIVGAGAAGLCAALAAKEAGVDAVVIERDAVPSGSTALSAGLIPAAGTRFQRTKGIADSPTTFAADIQRKAMGEADPAVVAAVAQGAGPLVEWLAERYGLPFDVVDNFNYPGHSAMRMHGLPSRTGRDLIDRLREAAEANDVVILTRSVVDQLLADAGGHIRGADIVHHGGTHENIGCDALILACNGYGGNPELVRRYIPEMADALYFGHPGNRGDAIIWGDALGAELSHLGAYQGHGSVATPHNILISWAVIMQGGIQVNREGRRFCDETHGYSEQAAEVLRQPGGFAWNVFDARIAGVARQFEDFRNAETAGALLTANTIDDLAKTMQVPASAFSTEWNEVEELKSTDGRDRYGRPFIAEQSCGPPYYAVKVTGALFHTQGGLAVDPNGRVKRKDGTTFPNLFAAGGASVGVSGSVAAGYLSGNGLLTATVLGRLAGRAAARNDAIK